MCVRLAYGAKSKEDIDGSFFALLRPALRLLERFSQSGSSRRRIISVIKGEINIS